MNISGWETHPELPVASPLFSSVRVPTPARSSGDLVCESKSWNESREVTEKTKILYGVVTSHTEP